MPDILNVLATLHGLGGDNVLGSGEQPGGGFNNLPGLGSGPLQPGGEQPGGGINNLPGVATPTMDQASNILQTLNPPDASGAPAAAPAAPTNPLIAAAPTPAPGAPPVSSPAAAQPRQKHSILDILGGISDVIAKVGGAAPQYQPSLDAATARANAITDRATAASDHTRQVNLDDMKLALLKNQAEVATTDAEKAREGNAIQYVQAVQAAGGDTGAAWAKAAGLAGVSPDRQQIIGQMIAADPKNEHGTLEGLDALRNGIEEYNTAPIQAYNAKTKSWEIVQVGKHGGKNITQLDDGFAIPAASAVNVDAGNVRELRDPRTGALLSHTAVGVSPDTAATNANRVQITGMQDASRADVAAAKAKAGKGGADDPYGAYTGARSAVVQMRDDIASLAKNPNIGSATGFINGAVDTPARQAVLAKIAAIEGQSVPVAVALLKANGVRNPAQKEVIATAKGLISDLHLLRQSTGSFKDNANASIARLNARVAGLDSAAQRTGVVKAPAAPARPILPAPAGARGTRAPSISNW